MNVNSKIQGFCFSKNTCEDGMFMNKIQLKYESALFESNKKYKRCMNQIKMCEMHAQNATKRNSLSHR